MFDLFPCPTEIELEERKTVRLRELQRTCKHECGTVETVEKHVVAHTLDVYLYLVELCKECRKCRRRTDVAVVSVQAWHSGHFLHDLKWVKINE